MFFYNEKQEFMGIDDDSLRTLGYNSFDEFLNDCSDVAELFEKEPGHIHKFQNLSWINFLLHAEVDNRLAIVNARNRKFVCTLEPHPLYLPSSAEKHGYIIKFVNIKNISGEAKISAAMDIKPDIAPKKPSDILPNYDDIKPTSLQEPGLLDVPIDSSHALELPQDEAIEDVLANIPTSSTFDEPDFKDDFTQESQKVTLDLDMDIFKSEPEIEKPQIKEVPKAPQAPTPQPTATVATSAGSSIFTPDELEHIKELEVSSDYTFDPSVAANELGLPVDLIEEFIGDFIYQAHEFKDELFESLDNSDINNLRILSHKLKGVAANLRIEDAFESLAIVNTSDDMVAISASLKYLYLIIDKLEGKGMPNIFGAPVEEPLFATADNSSADEEIYDFGELKLEDDSFIKPDDSSDDELYSFDIPAASEPSSEPEFKTFEDSDDDIYDFGELKLEDDFEIPIDELSSKSTKDEDIYSFDAPLDEPISTPESASFADNDEEIYNFAPLNIEDEIPATSEMIEPAEVAVIINKEKIAGELGIDREFLDELIADYKTELSKAATNITSYIGSFDTQGWKRTSANLVGISDNLRLTELSDLLKTIAQTHDAQEAKKASAQLHTLIEQL